VAPRDTAQAKPHRAPAGGSVDNPDYNRWARFEPGAWGEYDFSRTHAGVTTPTKMRATLLLRSDAAVLVERTLLGRSQQGELIAPRHVFITARINPQQHPITNPDAEVETLPDVQRRVGGQEITCQVRRVRSARESIGWGADVDALVHYSEQMPGGIVALDLKTSLAGERFQFEGQATDFDPSP
jgi:hypothetical protein